MRMNELEKPAGIDANIRQKEADLGYHDLPIERSPSVNMAEASIDVGEPVTKPEHAAAWYKKIKKSKWAKDLRDEGKRFVMHHYTGTAIVGIVATAAAITAGKMYLKHRRILEEAKKAELKQQAGH